MMEASGREQPARRPGVFNAGAMLVPSRQGPRSAIPRPGISTGADPDAVDDATLRRWPTDTARARGARLLGRVLPDGEGMAAGRGPGCWSRPAYAVWRVFSLGCCGWPDGRGVLRSSFRPTREPTIKVSKGMLQQFSRQPAASIPVSQDGSPRAPRRVRQASNRRCRVKRGRILPSGGLQLAVLVHHERSWVPMGPDRLSWAPLGSSWTLLAAAWCAFFSCRAEIKMQEPSRLPYEVGGYSGSPPMPNVPQSEDRVE